MTITHRASCIYKSAMQGQTVLYPQVMGTTLHGWHPVMQMYLQLLSLKNLEASHGDFQSFPVIILQQVLHPTADKVQALGPAGFQRPAQTYSFLCFSFYSAQADLIPCSMHQHAGILCQTTVLSAGRRRRLLIMETQLFTVSSIDHSPGDDLIPQRELLCDAIEVRYAGQDFRICDGHHRVKAFEAAPKAPVSATTPSYTPLRRTSLVICSHRRISDNGTRILLAVSVLSVLTPQHDVQVRCTSAASTTTVNTC